MLHRFLVPSIDELRQRLLNPIATMSHTGDANISNNVTTTSTTTTSMNDSTQDHNSTSSSSGYSSTRGSTAFTDVTVGLLNAIVPSSVTTYSAQDKLLQCELEDEALLPDDDDEEDS